ncbi:MAG TPA: sulfotransferase family 2 domain-containing protein [Candidatus Dormibacteraeota bacterium]|nr:sulfotransferase family 2 domain-containing protein [Candidatus Dormibacteraeota bacterium]
MPVFTEHACAFVHIPKTAGTSILQALDATKDTIEFGAFGLWDALMLHPEREAIVVDIRRSFRIATLREFPQQHLPAAALRRFLGEERWEKLFSFTFVRNPWDVVVSTYFFQQQYQREGIHREMDPDLAEIVARSQRFSDFVELYVVARADMTAMIVDERDRDIMSYVGRYESIDSDFTEICRRIGVTAQLPHDNASLHAGYRHYYNKRTRAIVARHFARDIDRFGYQF